MPLPAGWYHPIRSEDWYYINDGLFSCTVTVYPGEYVGLSEKSRDVLFGGREVDPEEPEGKIIVMRYADIADTLTRNGFVKL